VSVRVTGIREVRRMLEGLHRRNKSLRPFLDAEAERLSALVAKSWSTRTSPSGEAWAPYASGEGSGGSLRTAHEVKGSRKKLSMRVRSHIAAFHFFGTEYMPARNPLPFTRITGGYLADPEWLAAHAARAKAWLLGGEVGGTDGR